MSGRRTKTTLAGAVLCGLAVPAMAGPTSAPSAQDLQAQIASLKSQVAQMRQDQDQNWLNQRRQEEVKSLIKDVLNDAGTRSTLLQEGQMAGISEDGKIFLRSADGSFEFTPSGELQIRYIYNNHDNGGNGDDENVSGFQLRRARFIGDGHIGSPKIGYHFELSADSDDADSAAFEEYYLDYHFDNGVTARAGRFKQPFSREFLTDGTRQLAVERSVVGDYFSVGRSEGAQLAYQTDKWLLRGSLHNGSDALYTDFNTTSVDYALAGRLDYKVTGDWDQLDDSFNSWSGDGQAIFVGGAVDYEAGRTGTTAANNKVLKYTVDASLQQNGLSVFAAGYGQHTNNEVGDDYDDYGLVVQAGYFVVPDEVQPFVRYAGIFFDNDRPGLTSQNVNLLSAGLNWYQHRQMAKFTIDGVYVFNPIDSGLADAGAGLLPDGGDKGGQVALRAQYQLMF